MSFGARFLLTLFIVIVFLLVIAAFGYFSGGWEDDRDPLLVRFGIASAQSRPELCMDDESRERVREIMFNALDESLHDKIKDLMSVWLRDDTGQPARATKGMENALRAYTHARAQAIKFNPPECPP